MARLGSRGLGKERGERDSADHQHRADDKDAKRCRPKQPRQVGMPPDQLDQEEHGDQRKVLEQQHGERSLADTAFDARDWKHERRRGEC